uniref:Putative secreted protein n=1 Tax=Anopheles darlingi TaxID=43151 RepID=A0A2M4D4P8_ANODA
MMFVCFLLLLILHFATSVRLSASCFSRTQRIVGAPLSSQQYRHLLLRPSAARIGLSYRNASSNTKAQRQL